MILQAVCVLPLWIFVTIIGNYSNSNRRTTRARSFYMRHARSHKRSAWYKTAVPPSHSNLPRCFQHSQTTFNSLLDDFVVSEKQKKVLSCLEMFLTVCKELNLILAAKKMPYLLKKSNLERNSYR